MLWWIKRVAWWVQNVRRFHIPASCNGSEALSKTQGSQSKTKAKRASTEWSGPENLERVEDETEFVAHTVSPREKNSVWEMMGKGKTWKKSIAVADIHTLDSEEIPWRKEGTDLSFSEIKRILLISLQDGTEVTGELKGWDTPSTMGLAHLSIPRRLGVYIKKYELAEGQKDRIPVSITGKNTLGGIQHRRSRTPFFPFLMHRFSSIPLSTCPHLHSMPDIQRSLCRVLPVQW